MKKQLLFTTLSMLFSLNIFCQTQSISIKLMDKKNEPIIGANTVLKERIDTTKMQFGSTDTLGVVRFNVKNGDQLFLIATFIGFKTLNQGITVSDKKTTFQFVMEEQAETLKSFEIVSKKPLMRQEDDKTIVDPEPIANTCTNALEVMEKTPGLFVDQDGNIYISSTSPATVYINGREQRMSNSDIASMLKVLPPNSIEKIEILRTPSAKYDASNSGGLVNVVLKKGIKIGLTGSLNAGINQGIYGNQFIGFNVSNNDGDKTSFLNFNYTKSNNFSEINNDRFLINSILNQSSYTTLPADAVALGYGIGRELTKKWRLNYDGRVSYTFNNNETNTDNLIKNKSELITNNNRNKTLNKTGILALNQGFSTVYKIDTLGSELTTDFSYNYLQNQGNQDYLTAFILPKLNDISGNGTIDNKRHFFTAQMDLKYKFPHKITLETGFKIAVQDFRSATKYALNGQSDNVRTNTYNFNDNINAAYVQGSKKMGEFLLKIGSRFENTNMSGRQIVPSDTAFKINRTDAFPYVYLSRKVFSISGFELRSYLVARRTISRPTYDNLNPFPRFLDQYLYEAGNPSLKPQFTTNYEINISVDEMPIMALGKNYTEDIFTNVTYQDPRNALISYRTYDNLGKNSETYFKILGGIPPGGKFFFVVGAQYNYNDYRGVIDNSPLAFERGSWTFFTYQSLKIDKKTSFTMNGFMRVNGQLQFYELNNFGSLSFNLNRQFLDKKLTVSLNFNDAFFTNKYKFTLNQGGINAIGSRVNDSRRFGINARYNFGIRKKRESGENMFNLEPK
jgi:iron complex outermembrane recepter protein